MTQWQSRPAEAEGGVPVVRKAKGGARAKARRTRPPAQASALNEEEEQILQKAQIYLLFEAKRPMLWTVAGIREEKGDHSRRWIIAVHLRYPTGHEGYLGDLLFDGSTITELTDVRLMRERARQIAADPERGQKWHEYRNSALPPGEG
jgi:hypothetical protein